MGLVQDPAHYDHGEGNDDFIQPRAFRLVDKAQWERLFNNIAGAIQDVPEFIVERQCALSTALTPATAKVFARH